MHVAGTKSEDAKGTCSYASAAAPLPPAPSAQRRLRTDGQLTFVSHVYHNKKKLENSSEKLQNCRNDAWWCMPAQPAAVGGTIAEGRGSRVGWGPMGWGEEWDGCGFRVQGGQTTKWTSMKHVGRLDNIVRSEILSFVNNNIKHTSNTYAGAVPTP